MPILTHIDLRTDPAAAPYQKHEVVQVAFATAAGELISLEGPNRYQPGDAIVTGSTGDRWVVSRERFDARYQPLQAGMHGQDGAYQNIPGVVLAKRMEEAFSIARSAGGDVLHGAAGDWLMQYAPNDYGIVQQARFAQVYRPAQGKA